MLKAAERLRHPADDPSMNLGEVQALDADGKPVAN